MLLLTSVSNVALTNILFTSEFLVTQINRYYVKLLFNEEPADGCLARIASGPCEYNSILAKYLKSFHKHDRTAISGSSGKD